MSLTRHRTHVNGIDVTINDYDANGKRGATDARRLAAELPRGAAYIRKVSNALLGVDVWIEPPQDADESMVRYPNPDGWSIRHISHFSKGTICVTYQRGGE